MIKANTVLQMSLGLLLGCIQQTVWGGTTVIQVKDFSRIQDIVVAKDGSVWTTGWGKTQHLSAEGNLIKQIGNVGIGISKIELAADGSVWVLNMNTHNIQHYTEDGTFISEFGSFGDGIQFPRDLKIAQDNSVWLSDAYNHRIEHYHADGSLLGQFGTRGDQAGQFVYPSYLALDKDGSVWVTDGVGSISDAPFGNLETPRSHRLQHLSATGKFIGQFGSAGSEIGRFDNISDITVAADGSLWIADHAAFQHFKADGTFIEKINSYGSGSNFADANNIVLNADGSLWTVSKSVASGFPGAEGSDFLRHLNVDGSIVAQFKNKGACTTEYDDLQQTVYLWGVAVGKQYYDAVLQAQAGQFTLISAAPSTADCSNLQPGLSLSSFSLSNNILEIPFVSVVNMNYKASFQHQGNNLFTLQSAEPLKK